MKKFFTALVFVAVMSMSMICFAEISPNEVALGGITLGATRERVESVYGKPTKYDNENTALVYNYNDTFKVYFSSSGMAFQIVTTANNGIGTPSGVRVGMDASVLNKYGQVYRQETKGNVTYYYYWAPGRITLDFGVRNGKIVSIRAIC